MLLRKHTLGTGWFCLFLFVAIPVNGFGFDVCFDQAGHAYDISPELLRTIAWAESGLDPAAVNRNTNGSYDFGVMQINSSWERMLGRERWLALGDPCYNIQVGAWILRECMSRFGYTWEAVGCYNAVSRDKRASYARRIADELNKKNRWNSRTARQ